LKLRCSRNNASCLFLYIWCDLQKPATSFCYFKLLFVLVLWNGVIKAQPYVDIVSASSQHFMSQYSDSSKNKLYTQDNFLSLFLPVKFGKGHVFLLRINTEQLVVSRNDAVHSSYSLYSLSLPVGLQISSKNLKWKYTGIFIPKFNSDFSDDLSFDLQLGGIGLITRVFNGHLQVKTGLYYNAECFGHFFMPLAGVDWKVNDRFRMYGTLPGNYRFEFKLGKKLFTGLGFRSAQRSFRLQKTYWNDFVRVRENQLKLFLEGFVFGKFLMGIDVYRSINYKLIRYDLFDTKKQKSGLPVFSDSKDGFGFTVNLAYRIRTE
jgi:hypothetical protein